MMKKMMFLGAGAIGYVLGAKAGRERYDQIASQAQKLRSNPTVQKKMDDAKHVAKDAAGTAAGKAAGKVREHVPGGSSGSLEQHRLGASRLSRGEHVRGGRGAHLTLRR